MASRLVPATDWRRPGSSRGATAAGAASSSPSAAGFGAPERPKPGARVEAVRTSATRTVLESAIESSPRFPWWEPHSSANSRMRSRLSDQRSRASSTSRVELRSATTRRHPPWRVPPPLSARSRPRDRGCRGRGRNRRRAGNRRRSTSLPAGTNVRSARRRAPRRPAAGRGGRSGRRRSCRIRR